MTVVDLLGSAPIARLASVLSCNRLRAIAYHGVENRAALAAQLDEFRAQGYRTVNGTQFADLLRSGISGAEKTLWITFDDGDASVIQNALPLLRERGMVATAFLCGAWVGSDEVPWWTTVESAVAHGLVRADDMGDVDDVGNLVSVRLCLKRSSDDFRRTLVERFSERLRAEGHYLVGNQWSVDDLHNWLAAGNDVGNHSWDHPCLDRCGDNEQRRQIRGAHERLSELTGRQVDLFAWPNGDASPAAASELDSLGYRLVASCDHRVVAREPVPTNVSRLRLDSTADIVRTRAIVSGAHSAVFHLQGRLRGRVDNHNLA